MANAAILCGALEGIGWSVDSRNAITNKGLDSVQSLNLVIQLHLKTVCKSMRSAPDPLRTGSYQEFNVFALYLRVTNKLSHGHAVQGKSLMDTIALEYASQVCHLKESKKGDEEGLMTFPEACWKVKILKVLKKLLKNNLGSNNGLYGNLHLLLHVIILQVKILHLKLNSLFPLKSVSLTLAIASSVSMLRSSTWC